MLLINGLSKFPIKDNPVFRNGPKRLPKSPPDCPILCSQGIISKSFTKLETCLISS